MSSDENAMLMREIERTKAERDALYDELERQKGKMARHIASGIDPSAGPVVIKKRLFTRIKERLSRIFGGR